MPAAQIHPIDEKLTDHDITRSRPHRAGRGGAAAGPQAWDELMRRYGGLVKAVVRRYRLQEADAADAVQGTWCRAVEQLDTVRDRSGSAPG